MNELLKRARPLLALLAATGLVAGIVAHLLGEAALAGPIWTAVTLPILAALLLEIVVTLRRGEVGLDIVAGLSMTAALVFGESLAAADSAHAFGRQTHDQFGIGLIERGAQKSASGRGIVEAGAGDMITVNPGEVHDG